MYFDVNDMNYNWKGVYSKAKSWNFGTWHIKKWSM